MISLRKISLSIIIKIDYYKGILIMVMTAIGFVLTFLSYYFQFLDWRVFFLSIGIWEIRCLIQKINEQLESMHDTMKRIRWNTEKPDFPEDS